jgi:hypothetical protein
MMSGETGPNETMPACMESVILPRAHDIGGFEVRRALPARQRQMVAPSSSSTRWGLASS